VPALLELELEGRRARQVAAIVDPALERRARLGGDEDDLDLGLLGVGPDRVLEALAERRVGRHEVVARTRSAGLGGAAVLGLVAVAVVVGVRLDHGGQRDLEGTGERVGGRLSRQGVPGEETAGGAGLGARVWAGLLY
jgi:hypothetical protein